jgi:hypothetical protein
MGDASLAQLVAQMLEVQLTLSHCFSGFCGGLGAFVCWRGIVDQ